MREIEFRAWDSSSKNMFSEPSTMKDNELINDIFRDANVIWMQFTGLRDKAGVKIFEGDYCRSDYYLFGELVEGVVEFTHTGQYVLAQGSFKNSIHELVFNNWELEVIGNIWENPELVPVQDGGQHGK